MRKRVLFFGLFFILFLFIFNADVYSFSVCDENGVDLDFGDIELFNYTFVYKYMNTDGVQTFWSIMTFEDKPYFKSGSSRLFFTGKMYNYHYKVDSLEFSHVNKWGTAGNSTGMNANYNLNTLNLTISSNFDICNESGEILYNNNYIKLSLVVYPVDQTVKVPVLITNSLKFNYNEFRRYYIQYSVDNKKWEPMPHIISGDIGSEVYTYQLDVYKNGTYYFRLYDLDKDEFLDYESIKIDNIIYTQDTVDNYIDGVFRPTPFLGYEYINDSKIYITTQKFFIYEIIDLKCFYKKDATKDDLKDISSWNKVEVRTLIDPLTGDDVYQFYFEVDNSSFDADGTYFVAFYNVFLDEWTYSSIKIDFDEILNVDGSMLWKYLNFFKDRFGFLVYPFDLTIKTLKRISSINYSEPKFNIPDIYEPTTNKKLISSTVFNFNDYLENDTFKTVHNIYLIIIDAAIIFGLLNLASKKISEVFK